MNQFITRIVNHVVNEVIVAGLAKSQTFQRFAVKTEATLQNVQKASAESIVKRAFGDSAAPAEGGSAAASASASSEANAARSGHRRTAQPPPKPMTGFPGFVSAFIKEIQSDLGATRKYSTGGILANYRYRR